MSKIVREGKKIIVKKDEKEILKAEREQRIKDRKDISKTNITNREVFEYLNDTNDRLEEIYDLIKSF